MNNNNDQFMQILPIIIIILVISMYMYKDKEPEVDNTSTEAEEEMYSDIASVREYEENDNNVDVYIDNSGYENMVEENSRYRIINGFTYISTSYDDRTMYLNIRELLDDNDSILVTGFAYTPQGTLVEEMCFTNIFIYSNHCYTSADGTMVIEINNGKVSITESVFEDGSNADYLFNGEFEKINEDINAVIPYLSADELSDVINDDNNIGKSFSFKATITEVKNSVTSIQVDDSDLYVIGYIDNSIADIIKQDTIIVTGTYTGIVNKVPEFDITQVKVTN